jgi:3,4-dihydroxy 2-butanone 4-phosphate synthase/GTP cyclohydrolase II
MTLDTLFTTISNAHPPAGRPHITLSYAQSLDGSIAGRAGQTLGLSSPESLLITHRLRAAHDAILVGIGTVLADNPRLTVRLVEGPSPQPIVLDARLRTPVAAALFHHPRPPWLACRRSSAASLRATDLAARGARLIPLPMTARHRLSLPHLVRELAASGMRRLMVEGGAQVISAFVAAGLVDLLVLTVTPHLVGGLHALHLPAADLQRLPRLQTAHCQPAGPDWIIWGTLA